MPLPLVAIVAFAVSIRACPAYRQAGGRQVYQCLSVAKCRRSSEAGCASGSNCQYNEAT